MQGVQKMKGSLKCSWTVEDCWLRNKETKKANTRWRCYGGKPFLSKQKYKRSDSKLILTLFESYPPFLTFYKTSLNVLTKGRSDLMKKISFRQCLNFCFWTFFFNERRIFRFAHYLRFSEKWKRNIINLLQLYYLL